MTYRIPFNRACLTGNEPAYVAQAVANGHISGDGPFTRNCQELLRQELGAVSVLLTTSCTDALEMCATLLNLKRGDEVILPSFTFVSTANAFVLRGAVPVFADIRSDTLNLDERQPETLVTERTRAIVAVHYAGVACEMDAITAVAERHGLVVVEDNAHGLFARYRGRMLGTLGALATQSFHETKNFTCGEGGALVINRPEYVERAEIIREKGTNRSRFFRGQVDKYTWVDVGSSHLPSDMLAAFLFAQLESREAIQAKRRQIWENYYELTSDLARRLPITLPVVPPHCDQPYHLFYLLLESIEVRQALIAHLKSHGILAVFHYLPLHLSAMGRTLGGERYHCPITEYVSDHLLRLPFYNELTLADQEDIVSAIGEFYTHKAARRGSA
ncbi:MAG TPA: dTDP-4-amino-4,6-dideoxygalactose transaminase [Bryobacteraceae bacterium]|nr:dTDP-4-amino-4,6-dideoxygalactose transaminase [Bryobacteraceae bacterium]